jgi:hypothetical protein
LPRKEQRRAACEKPTILPSGYDGDILHTTEAKTPPPSPAPSALRCLEGAFSVVNTMVPRPEPMG